MKQMELELLSENIANSETPGFKGRSLSFRDYLINENLEDSRTMTYLQGTRLRLTPGPFMKTDNKLDIAIEGKGFLSLEGGLYTRRGDLTRTQDGHLVTASGKRVIGEKEPIRLPEGKIEIKEDGSIYVDGNMVDKLKIMVRLISTLREFETFQKAIQTLDEAAGKINYEVSWCYLCRRSPDTLRHHDRTWSETCCCTEDIHSG